MLNWANRFNICCFLDNHAYQFMPHTQECLLAAGAIRSLSTSAGMAFQELREFSDYSQDWLFGHFSFDLKNETENLSSSNLDPIGFPDLHFFVPKIIIELKPGSIRIGSCEPDHEEIFRELMASQAPDYSSSRPLTILARFSHEEYLDAVQRLRQHILYGDCYEINFCQEFYAEYASIDPLEIYKRLSETSPTPFGAFYKMNDKFLLCASPERYLKKEGRRLLSQPIKGTEPRNREYAHLDEANRAKLFHSSKDRSENIMVVDLVRNDLSKICEEGSVRVDELYGIYSFPQVHQMISTVSGTLAPETHWVEAIRATFPMGSMTGAPKRKVLELIEKYEKTRRGLFSGALGYCTPEGDFDFNVVIRSILYNQSGRYLSWQAGSAITFQSDPEKEYQECLLKASAIRKVLAQ